MIASVTQRAAGFFVCIMMCALAIPAFAGGGALPVMTPLQEDAGGGVERGARVKAKGELRKGKVMLATDYFFPAGKQGKREAAKRLFKGRSVTLTFFDGQEYHIKLDAERRTDALISVSGRLEGHDLSSFSLTVGPETYVLDLQDLDAGILYNVVGETANGLGTVRAIDVKEAPPFTYSKPLFPPYGE